MTLDSVEEVLRKSRWMRFSLEYKRGRWCATFFHETGKLYAKAWRLDAETAIENAVQQALANTGHLTGAGGRNGRKS